MTFNIFIHLHGLGLLPLIAIPGILAAYTDRVVFVGPCTETGIIA
jgi:hypothetical protein